jgi:DNA-binding GntR family transcriptional regulator
MNKDQFKNLQAKLESIWNEDSFIVNDAPVEEADETEVAGHDSGLLKQVSDQIAQDVANNDYTAIDELLKNVTTSEMQGFLSEMESTVEETEVAEAVKGPGVDAINDLLDMGVSKEDLFDQMMRDHSDDELMSFADDYRRTHDFPGMEDMDDEGEGELR